MNAGEIGSFRPGTIWECGGVSLGAIGDRRVYVGPHYYFVRLWDNTLPAIAEQLRQFLLPWEHTFARHRRAITAHAIFLAEAGVAGVPGIQAEISSLTASGFAF